MQKTPKGSQNPLSLQEKKARRKRRIWRTIVTIAGFLVIIRIALPVVALKLINNKLEKLPQYLCHVEDLDVSFMDLSFTLKGIDMWKRNGKVKVPFFKCNQINIHVESFKKRASRIWVDSCVLNLVKGQNKESSQLTLDEAWIELARKMPLKPNTFIVRSGELHYLELYRKPHIDVIAKKISIRGENLENLKKITDSLPSRITLTAIAEGAQLKSVIKLDKQKQKPEIKATTSLSPMPLKNINDVLRAYTQFDVESGTFSMHSQFHVKNNHINGFAKPVVKKLVLFDREKDKHKPFGKRVKEAAIQLGANILKNNKTEQITAKVEISGNLKNPKVSIWQIILDGLCNAFSNSVVEGLSHPEK